MCKKVMYHVVCIALVLSVAMKASAVTYGHFDNSSGDNKWGTATNWVTDVVPSMADVTDVYLGVIGDSLQPVIVDGTQPVAQFQWLTIGYNTTGRLDIVSGGQLGVAGGIVSVGGHGSIAGTAYGVMNVDGAGSLALAENCTIGNNGGIGIVNVTNNGAMILGWWGTTIGDTGTGTINIVNGTVKYYGGGLTIGANGKINIYNNSEFILHGDQTALANSLVAAGKIRGDGVIGVGNVIVAFDEDNNYTVVRSSHSAQIPMTLEKGVTFDRQFRAIPVENYCKIYPEDVNMVKKLGFDFAKLLFNPALLKSGSTINTANMWYVDELVNRFVSMGVPVVICIHPENDFKTAHLGDPSKFAELLGFYTDFGAYIAARWGAGEVAFELMTEPHGNYTSWNTMLPQMWSAARSAMPNNIIILDAICVVQADGTGTVERFVQLEPVADDNVYYSFTTYAPFVFTLQGAWWTGSSSYFPGLQRVPYPSSPAIIAAEKPRILAFLASEGYDTAVADADLTAYGNDTWNKSKQLAMVAPIVAWNNAHGGNLKVLCAEFGALDANIASRINGIEDGVVEADRIKFLKDRREAFEESGIHWSVWSYNEAFTIFDPTVRVDIAVAPSAWIDNATLDALGLPLCGCGCKVQPSSPYDFNADCHVNMADLAVMVDAWLNCTEPTDPMCIM
jgi:endoglucanase